MLRPEQYDEFAADLRALAALFRAVLPAIAAVPFNLQEAGSPGIFLTAHRAAEPRFPFPISIVIRWSDRAIEEYLHGNANERKEMRALFGGNIPEILGSIVRNHGGIDWETRSQASARDIGVDLDDFLKTSVRKPPRQRSARPATTASPAAYATARSRRVRPDKAANLRR